MPRINRDEMERLFGTRRGANIVTLYTKTKPDMLLRGNPYREAQKWAIVNGVINWIYETSVNRQRIREGKEPDFQAFPRKWGYRIRGTPFVRHRDNLYLELKRQAILDCEYREPDGSLIETNHIEPFLKPQDETSRQGVDNLIILRDYRLDHIFGFNMDGDRYVVVD